MYALKQLEKDMIALADEYAEATSHLAALLKVQWVTKKEEGSIYIICPHCKIWFDKDDVKDLHHEYDCPWKKAEMFLQSIESKYGAKRHA